MTDTQDTAIDALMVLLEAALFASEQPLSINRLKQLIGDEELPNETIKEALAKLEEIYAERAVNLRQLASGYCFQICRGTEVVKLMEKPHRFSRAFLETLAIIAYRQPVTRADIESIRGVAVSSNIIRTLLECEWIREVGTRDVPGKPTLFGTTKTFLDHFNLKRLSELPPLASLEENAAEIEALMPKAEATENPEPEQVSLALESVEEAEEVL